MKIGEKYEITTDKFNFILTEAVEGKDKNGNPKDAKRVRFYGTIEQACHAILQRETDAAITGTAQEVIAAITRAQRLVSDALIMRSAA